jgi:hypothetical protein
MVKTRQLLLENFDEEVQEKLRVRAEDSVATRSRYEKMLIDISRAELGDCAQFDDGGFRLLRLPDQQLQSVELGRYELPRRSGDAHLYRIGHPLAEWVTHQAKSRVLPNARLIFDYDAYGTQVSTLKAYRGQTGWLAVKLITVEALGSQEQHLIIAANTVDGKILIEDDPEKLLRFPATSTPSAGESRGESQLSAVLVEDLETRKQNLLREINQRNLGYFQQEVEKLDAWADDLKLGLEQEIKEIDREVKEIRRTAATAPTLDEKLHWQKRQRELEAKRNKLRRELFDRQDEIESQRNQLIEELEMQLQQQVAEHMLFTIEWELE